MSHHFGLWIAKALREFTPSIGVNSEMLRDVEAQNGKTSKTKAILAAASLTIDTRAQAQIFCRLSVVFMCVISLTQMMIFHSSSLRGGKRSSSSKQWNIICFNRFQAVI